MLDFAALCNRPHWVTVPFSISAKLERSCVSSSECVTLELSLSMSLSECMTLCCWDDWWRLPANTPLAGWLCDWNNRGAPLLVAVWETGTLNRAGLNKCSLLALDSGHGKNFEEVLSLVSMTCCCRCSLLSSYHDLGVTLPLRPVSPIELQTKPETLKLHLKVHTSAVWSCMQVHERFRPAQ